jgi:hypothetical protein
VSRGQIKISVRHKFRLISGDPSNPFIKNNLLLVHYPTNKDAEIKGPIRRMAWIEISISVRS